MRRLVTTSVLATMAFAFTLARAEAEGNVNFLIGQKTLADEETESPDSNAAVGAIMSFGSDAWPILIAVDVLGYGATEEQYGLELTAATFEIAAGVRKIWKAGAARPYLGGGVGVVGAAVEVNDGVNDVEGDGSGFGPWAGGGVLWRLGQHFNIGVDARWNKAVVDLEFETGEVLEDVEVGGLSYGLTLGWGW